MATLPPGNLYVSIFLPSQLTKAACNITPESPGSCVPSTTILHQGGSSATRITASASGWRGTSVGSSILYALIPVRCVFRLYLMKMSPSWKSYKLRGIVLIYQAIRIYKDVGTLYACRSTYYYNQIPLVVSIWMMYQLLAHDSGHREKNTCLFGTLTPKRETTSGLRRRISIRIIFPVNNRSRAFTLSGNSNSAVNSMIGSGASPNNCANDWLLVPCAANVGRIQPNQALCTDRICGGTFSADLSMQSSPVLSK